VDKHTGKLIHVIILTHSSFCVLNLALPAWRPNFAKVAYTTSKVE